jgi:predicted RecA/RadA family phage recombinase
MHKVDGPGNVNGRFVSGNPLAVPPEPPTIITPEILNAIQTELTTLVSYAGLPLNKADNTQVTAAIVSLITNAIEVTLGSAIAFQAGQDYVAGKYYRIGSAIGGVCKASTLTGANVTLRLCGYFLLAKVPAEAYTFGDRLYWNAGAEQLTSDGSGGKDFVGVCVANTLAGALSVYTRLWSIHELPPVP